MRPASTPASLACTRTAPIRSRASDVVGRAKSTRRAARTPERQSASPAATFARAHGRRGRGRGRPLVLEDQQVLEAAQEEVPLARRAVVRVLPELLVAAHDDAVVDRLEAPLEQLEEARADPDEALLVL